MKKILKYLLESLLIVTMLAAGISGSTNRVYAAGGENIDEACEGVVRVFSVFGLPRGPALSSERPERRAISL